MDVKPSQGHPPEPLLVETRPPERGVVLQEIARSIQHSERDSSEKTRLKLTSSTPQLAAVDGSGFDGIGEGVESEGSERKSALASFPTIAGRNERSRRSKDVPQLPWASFLFMVVD